MTLNQRWIDVVSRYVPSSHVDQRTTFANSVEPDETAIMIMNGFIWINTVANLVSIYD